MDLEEEFYADENFEAEQQSIDSKAKIMSKHNQGDGLLQDIQKDLKGCVSAVN